MPKPLLVTVRKECLQKKIVFVFQFSDVLVTGPFTLLKIIENPNELLFMQTVPISIYTILEIESKKNLKQEYANIHFLSLHNDGVIICHLQISTIQS